MSERGLRNETREAATIALVTGIFTPLGIILWIWEIGDIIWRWHRRRVTNGKEGN